MNPWILFFQPKKELKQRPFHQTTKFIVRRETISREQKHLLGQLPMPYPLPHVSKKFVE